MNFSKDPIDSFVLMNNLVLKIEDLETLGIYAYIQMLIQAGETIVPKIITQISNKFFMAECDVLEHLGRLIKLHLLTMARIE